MANFFKFQPFPSTPSVTADDTRWDRCGNIVFGVKTRPLLLGFHLNEDKFWLLPPFSLIRDFSNENACGNVSKISVNHPDDTPYMEMFHFTANEIQNIERTSRR